MAETAGRRTVLIAVCLIVFATALVWAWRSQSGLQHTPGLNLQIIDGRTISLAELNSGPVVITFWASTCEICLKKTPELKALYQTFQPQGLELIAVAMSYDPPDRVLAFARDYQIPYPIALDLDGSVARTFDEVKLTPTTFLLNSTGKIVFRHTGNFNVDELGGKISKILLQSGHNSVKASS